MPICNKCGTDKPAQSFAKNKQRPNGLNNWCKDCKRAYQKDWYETNKAKHSKAVRKRNMRLKQDHYAKLAALKLRCEECGEDRIPALDFDHLDPSRKRSTISRLVSSGYSWKTIEAEMKQCRVLCANCHRMRTAAQQGWYNGSVAQ